MKAFFFSPSCDRLGQVGYWVHGYTTLHTAIGLRHNFPASEPLLQRG